MTRGITFSAFDLFHAGHVSMLSEAKQQCDYLIACIHADPSVENSDKHFTGKEEFNLPSKEVYYNYRQHTFSSSELRERITCKDK